VAIIAVSLLLGVVHPAIRSTNPSPRPITPSTWRWSVCG